MTIEEYLRWHEILKEAPPTNIIVDVWQYRPDRGATLSHNIWNGKEWVEKPYGRITHWRLNTMNYPCPPNSHSDYFDMINSIRAEYGMKPLQEDGCQHKEKQPTLFD